MEKDAHKVKGTMPIFITDNLAEREEVAMLLARITLGMVHDLKNGVYILVRH